MPQIHNPTVQKFQTFVREWVRKRLVPIEPDADTSLKCWLEKTTYPRSRKDELSDKWERIGRGRFWKARYHKVKAFVKREQYNKWKHARGIYSRTDEFKCKVGPIFKLIEEQVFKLKYFIKKIPIRDRPKYMRDMLYRVGAKYMATDYTGYESTFVLELMEACEFELYDYMTSGLPEHDEFMNIMRTVLGGVNICEFKQFTAKIKATRMSGEMNTSLGNGFSNLMILLFLMSEIGVDPDTVEACIEGDDCVCVADQYPTAADFARLGAEIKIEIHENLETASFCGLIYDPVELINVTNPIEVVAQMGWTNDKYLRASPKTKKMLLKVKALSYAHQYPGCPIIQEMAKTVLRLTPSINIENYIKTSRNLDEWNRTQLLEALNYGIKNLTFPEPGIRTRLLVESQFGITITQQRLIETQFQEMTELAPFRSAICVSLSDPSWVDYYDRYSSVRTSEPEYPRMIFPVVNDTRLGTTINSVLMTVWTDPMIRFSSR